MYMPILKWRQGEYLALEKLESNIKDKVVPLIEIPPIEWDFESGSKAKTIDKHLQPFAKRLEQKWRDRTAYIDLNYIEQTISMQNGIHPLIYVFENARKINTQVKPVTGLARNSSYQEAIRSILRIDQNGVCIRLHFSDLVQPNIEFKIEALLNYLEIDLFDVDLVLDLEAPNFEPIDVFVRLIRNAVIKLPQIDQVRSFTIAATNFPESMGNLEQGVNLKDRLEWKFLLEYRASLKASERKPSFGDYCIAHPKLLQLDMRLISPSASLRYATDGTWWIYKGTNTRRRNGLKQYKNICACLVNSSCYSGQSYSAGDQYIWNCSSGNANTGNLTTWRWVGTNRHITKVVNDCANFPGF